VTRGLGEAKSRCLMRVPMTMISSSTGSWRLAVRATEIEHDRNACYNKHVYRYLSIVVRRCDVL
jgi:hypothetical protein